MSWHPITDYRVDPHDLANQELPALSKVWKDRKDELAGIDEFTARLKREWAIETGLIERLYVLDRGITELLIERGIDAALIPHQVTGDAERTVALITDQEEAIDSVFSFVKGDRPLSTSYVKELHSLFTRNQEFAEGRDVFGRRTKALLIRGAYKERPNNPTRPDGTIHQYCPPEHVAAEMDRLIELHREHDAKGIAPEVEAAWLHHRFAQIHPFQDGNGRVARALATLILLKEDWLPLVIRNEERATYIGALETADRGDLQPLVGFFSGLQKRAFIEALGVARDTEKAIRVDLRIQAIRRRMAQRRDSLMEEWGGAKSSASGLHEWATKRMGEVRDLLQDASSDHHEFEFFVDAEPDGGDRSHYYHRQIVSTAKALGYYANTKHHRSWIRLGLVVKNGNPGNILISFHGIGREFQGVLVCSATWYQRVKTDDDASESEGDTALSDDVFQINYEEGIASIEQRFGDWLESAIDRGLALWEKTTL